MEAIILRQADRKKAKLRIGIAGPSGSGKTYSALLLASGMADWDKIALIDTENRSGDMYSDLGPYNVIELEAPFTPDRYIAAINAAEEAGMQVIIIDSVTHEWDGDGGILRSNDILAQAKFKGNTWAAWSESTPKHQRFLDKIISSRAHIITTVRSKTETAQKDGKVTKVGIKEIQRDGFEYELTVNFSLEREGHYALASKDRTNLFIAAEPFVISVETGKVLKAWSDSGRDEEAEKEKAKVEEQKKAEEAMQNLVHDIDALLAELGHDRKFLETSTGKMFEEITWKELTKLGDHMRGIIKERIEKNKPVEGIPTIESDKQPVKAEAHEKKDPNDASVEKKDVKALKPENAPNWKKVGSKKVAKSARRQA